MSKNEIDLGIESVNQVGQSNNNDVYKQQRKK